MRKQQSRLSNSNGKTRGHRPRPQFEDIERVVEALAEFNFCVDPDDFILYELARMIDEDRATLEDDEFRSLMDEGIREHIEGNGAIRSALRDRLQASIPEMDIGAAAVAERVIAALEKRDSDLRNVTVLVHAYTAYLFNRLENLDVSSAEQDRAQEFIERWARGEVAREALIDQLRKIGRPAVAPAADLLFDAPEDLAASQTAVDILAGISSPASARVLTHAVSEPMLSEEVEAAAFSALRKMWLLSRPYILYTLRRHMHEDLPFRWFQLFIEADDPLATDLVLEEIQIHGENPVYREDLIALLELLRSRRNPEAEDKVLGLINAPETPAATKTVLEGFLRER
jgi:hypothetical protein